MAPLLPPSADGETEAHRISSSRPTSQSHSWPVREPDGPDPAPLPSQGPSPQARSLPKLRPSPLLRTHLNSTVCEPSLGLHPGDTEVTQAAPQPRSAVPWPDSRGPSSWAVHLDRTGANLFCIVALLSPFCSLSFVWDPRTPDRGSWLRKPVQIRPAVQKKGEHPRKMRWKGGSGRGPGAEGHALCEPTAEPHCLPLAPQPQSRCTWSRCSP